MARDFTIGVLLYGDHYDLAVRCLQSLMRCFTEEQVEIRIAMNEACEKTRAYVNEIARHSMVTVVLDNPTNIHKYPAMRHLIKTAPLSKYFMWFDDDSYLSGIDTYGGGQAWLQLIWDTFDQPNGPDMLGAIYTINFQGQQREWIMRQPWYGGQVPQLRSHIRFCTGAWWTIRSKILENLDYPWATLDHRGGDTMLGEALYQRGHALQMFRRNVAINADADGNECRAVKRGFDQKPIGFELGNAPVLTPAAPVVSTPRQRRPVLELDI